VCNRFVDVRPLTFYNFLKRRIAICKKHALGATHIRIRKNAPSSLQMFCVRVFIAGEHSSLHTSVRSRSKRGVWRHSFMQ